MLRHAYCTPLVSLSLKEIQMSAKPKSKSGKTTAAPRKARMPASSYNTSSSSRKGSSNARRDRSAKGR